MGIIDAKVVDGHLQPIDEKVYCGSCADLFIHNKKARLAFTLRSNYPKEWTASTVAQLLSDSKDIPYSVVIEKIESGHIVHGKVNYGSEWLEFTHDQKSGKLYIEDGMSAQCHNIIQFPAMEENE